MFAEVFKKDSLQEEEYAECYVFDKRMLLPKADSEPYSSDYDETIIKNFHQKQSSYAQSEGYHSYVSSNDSAIIAPFSDSPADDRPQADSDFMLSTEEMVFPAPKHSNSITDFVNWPVETSKFRNSYSHSGNMKNVNYDRYNSQHIAHSARVQTPQKHHSETVLYLDAAKAPQQQFLKDANQNHCYTSSQLRKLYPVHTYSVQPQAAVASNVTSGVSEFNGAKQLQPSLPPPPSKFQASKHFYEIDSQQFDDSEHCAEYTFLDPSKKRIVSNQNLKVIQKQALISYYERHHSAWRSEPQLSFDSSLAQSQSRPRLPTPTSSCHLTSPSDDEESISTDRPISTNCNAENFTRDNVSAAIECRADYSCRTSPLEPTLNDLAISSEDRIPELPPKKACFRATAVTHRMPSPDLPPPSPPPLSDEELYISDEPLPPPPPLCEAAFVCDSPKTASSAVVCKISTANCDISTNATASMSSFSSRSVVGTRANTRGASGVRGNELFSRSSLDIEPLNVVRCDAPAYTESTRILNDKNPPSTADCVGKTIDSVLKCSSSRLSSSSFRTYTRTANEFNANIDKYIKRQTSSPSAALFCEKQRNSCKLTRTKDMATTPQSARGSETHQIEPKVKTIRTLFEDKFRKSINSKHFQFPSFSFMHSDKFPSKLDPRFPRTSYQITQCSNYREIRDSEEGIVSNATAVYKRTSSPTRQTQGLQSASSFRKMINDAKYDEPYDSTAMLSSSQTTDVTTVTCSSEYASKANNDSAVNENTPSANAFAASVFEDRVAEIPLTERSVVKHETIPLAQRSSSSSPFSVIRAKSVSSSSLNSINIPKSQSVLGLVGLGFSEGDAVRFSNEAHSTYTVPILADTTRIGGRCSPVTNSVCRQKKVDSSHCEISNTSSRTNGSKNCTIDAASQTDINVISKEHILTFPAVDVMLPRIDVEVEKLRREVINCLGPSNRLHKILADKSDVKKSTDYLENIFQGSAALKVPAFLKNSACVNEPEDTRLQEGSISYHETELEILQQNPRSEICDKSQNVSPPMVCLLQKKKKNLIKHLIHKLGTLKAEQNVVSKERHQNDELGTVISEKFFRRLSSREASKYKLHIQEVGHITNLLLSLGARLAKIENSLTNLPENCQNEKKILEDKKQQLVLQLEDAKELKKNIDKRSLSLTSLLQKYFNEQELNEYQQFIQTKCQLLICNRNLSDEVFQIEQQMSALKENDLD